MSNARESAAPTLPPTPWGELPPHMRVLFITGSGRTGGWLADSFACDSATKVTMVEATGVADGLARLRDEVFDAVLISHEGAELDAVDLVDAVRAGSSEDQPIVVLGSECEQQMAALCYEAGADVYVRVETTTTRTLIWGIARAAERHRLLEENRRLRHSQQHRLKLEQDEATRLLAQQKAILAGSNDSTSRSADDWTDDEPTGCSSALRLPRRLIEHYRELLRAHVIMGSGNLAKEMKLLSHMLATAGITSDQVMLLHVVVLEEMIRGLGCRSARHVMNRADLMILEVMIKLAEEYRERFLDGTRPPSPMTLSGFDELPQTADRAA